MQKTSLFLFIAFFVSSPILAQDVQLFIGKWTLAEKEKPSSMDKAIQEYFGYKSLSFAKEGESLTLTIDSKTIPRRIVLFVSDRGVEEWKPYANVKDGGRKVKTSWRGKAIVRETSFKQGGGLTAFSNHKYEVSKDTKNLVLTIVERADREAPGFSGPIARGTERSYRFVFRRD